MMIQFRLRKVPANNIINGFNVKLQKFALTSYRIARTSKLALDDDANDGVLVLVLRKRVCRKRDKEYADFRCE
jgi:hypothetical protein